MSPSADPLVLLPGMNCSERLWWPVADGLRGRGIDRELQLRQLDGATVDDCVTGLLRTLPDRFALAGLSLGGIVAMALVRRAPERVSRLCLMSTNARGPAPEQRAAWAARRRALAAGASARDLQRDLLPVLLGPGSRSPGLDEEVLRMADEVGDARLDDQLAMQASRVDERPGLGRIGVPTLIVAAGQDALCPIDRHQEMHRLIADSHLTVLAGVGHLAPLEAPDVVATVLAEWFTGDSAGSAAVAAGSSGRG